MAVYFHFLLRFDFVRARDDRGQRDSGLFKGLLQAVKLARQLEL